MIKNALIGGVDRLNGEPADAINQNETENAIINASLKGQAQIPFSILKSAGAFTNEGHLCADRTTDANGINNTINTISTNATYNSDGDYYNCYNGDISMGEDTADYSNTSGSYQTYVSKSPADYIHSVEIQTQASLSRNYRFKVTFNYNDLTSADSTESIITSALSLTTSLLLNPNPGKVVSTFDVKGKLDSTADSPTLYLRNTEWFELGLESSVIADTGTLTLDGTENAISIYNDAIIPTNTSMSVVVSDGTNSTSSYPLGAKTSTIIPIEDLSSGTLKMTFTLATTDTTVTPTWSGYGVVIAK